MVQDQLIDVQKLQSAHGPFGGAFAATLAGGKVVTWGDSRSGGDSTAVQDQLKHVRHLQVTGSAFAVILADGTVVTWGDPRYGGDSSRVSAQLRKMNRVAAFVASILFLMCLLVRHRSVLSSICQPMYHILCHLTLSSWWLDVAHQILHCEKPAHAVDTLKLLTCASKNSPLATAASFEARVTEYNQQKSLSSPAQIELHPDHEDRFGET